MASFVERFNTDVKIKKHSDLQKDKKFLIIRAEIGNTQFGETVLLTLLDKEKNEKFKLYLSKKYREAFDPETIKSINDETVKYNLQYKGVENKSVKFWVEENVS